MLFEESLGFVHAELFDFSKMIKVFFNGQPGIEQGLNSDFSKSQGHVLTEHCWPSAIGTKYHWVRVKAFCISTASLKTTAMLYLLFLLRINHI